MSPESLPPEKTIEPPKEGFTFREVVRVPISDRKLNAVQLSAAEQMHAFEAKLAQERGEEQGLSPDAEAGKAQEGGEQIFDTDGLPASAARSYEDIGGREPTPGDEGVGIDTDIVTETIEGVVATKDGSSPQNRVETGGKDETKEEARPRNPETFNAFLDSVAEGLQKRGNDHTPTFEDFFSSAHDYYAGDFDADEMKALHHAYDKAFAVVRKEPALAAERKGTSEQEEFLDHLKKDIEDNIEQNLHDFEKERGGTVKLGESLPESVSPPNSQVRGIFEREREQIEKKLTPPADEKPTLHVEEDVAVPAKNEAAAVPMSEPGGEAPPITTDRGNASDRTTYERHKNALKQIVRAQGGDHSKEFSDIIDDAFEAARRGEGDEAAFLAQAKDASGNDKFAQVRERLVAKAFAAGEQERAARGRGELPEVVESSPHAQAEDVIIQGQNETTETEAAPPASTTEASPISEPVAEIVSSPEVVSEPPDTVTSSESEPPQSAQETIQGDEIIGQLNEAYFKPLTPEELRDGEVAARKTLESLPLKERKKIGVGLHNWGLYVKSWSAEQLETAIRKAGGTGEWTDAWAQTYHKQYLEAEKDIALAQEAREKGGSGFGMRRSLGSAGLVAGMASKVARLGLSSFGYIPFRGLMTLSMATAKGSEVIREVNERRVANTTRIADADQAFDEAMALYGEAQARAGGDEATKESLDQVYTESIPADLKQRLEKMRPEDRAGWFERKIQTFVANRVAGFNEKLAAAKGDEDRQQLVRKYSRMLNKYSRLIEEAGTVHTFAWGVEKVELASKVGIAALSVDTWLRGIKATGAFGALSSFLFNVEKADVPVVESGATGMVVERPIGHLGAWGATRDVLRDEEMAQAFGWDKEGPPPYNWREAKTRELWQAYESQALKDGAILEQLRIGGYSRDRDGLLAMMRRMEGGGIKLDPTTKTLSLVNGEQVSNQPTTGVMGEVAKSVPPEKTPTHVVEFPASAGSVEPVPAQAVEALSSSPEQGAVNWGMRVETRVRALDGYMRELLAKNASVEMIASEQRNIMAELEGMIKEAKTDAERQQILDAMAGEYNRNRANPVYHAMGEVMKRHGYGASTPAEAEAAQKAMRAQGQTGSAESYQNMVALNNRIDKMFFEASGGQATWSGVGKMTDRTIEEIRGNRLAPEAWLNYYASKVRLDQPSGKLRGNVDDMFAALKLDRNDARYARARVNLNAMINLLMQPK